MDHFGRGANSKTRTYAQQPEPDLTMLNLETVRDEIKAIATDCKGTPTAKLCAILAAVGIDKAKDQAAILGITERAIRKAKAEPQDRNHSSERNYSSGTTVPKRNHSSEKGTTVPELQFRSSPAPIRARLESPSGIDSNLEVLDSPSSVPPKAKSKRGSRLPQDWQLPDDWRQWARMSFVHASDSQVTLEADKFRDFWHAKPGQGACKLDWEATWRNWCRNSSTLGALPSKQPINWGRSSWDEQRAAKHEQTRALLAQVEAMGAA